MGIYQFQISNFQNFTYLIESEGKAMVVDPQKDMGPWLKILEERQAQLVGCLLTHTHWDHILGVAEVARRFMVPVWVHPLEEPRLVNEPKPVHRAVRYLDPQVPMLLGHLTIETLHTPGHSSGEVCFLVKGETPWALLSGDTVFVREVGRCDLPTGSVHEMFETLQRLKQLPDDTIIYPGHDYGPTPTSTLGEEKQNSAAFLARTVEELDALP